MYKVGKGNFSVILAPYIDNDIPPTTFLYVSEHQLTIFTLAHYASDVPIADQGPGAGLCWLGENVIYISAAKTFLENTDYKGTITHKGETIHIDTDTQCQRAFTSISTKLIKTARVSILLTQITQAGVFCLLEIGWGIFSWALMYTLHK